MAAATHPPYLSIYLSIYILPPVLVGAGKVNLIKLSATIINLLSLLLELELP
jgi:hypothetical protein